MTNQRKSTHGERLQGGRRRSARRSRRILEVGCGEGLLRETARRRFPERNVECVEFLALNVRICQACRWLRRVIRHAARSPSQSTHREFLHERRES